VVPALELDPIVHGGDPEEDTNIRDDDLEDLGRLEKVARKGVEICFRSTNSVSTELVQHEPRLEIHTKGSKARRGRVNLRFVPLGYHFWPLELIEI
jgi:hypothetical protein